MNLKRILGACAIAAVVSTTMLGAGRSELADAVMKGDKAKIRTLLDQRVDVNAAQADGSTALHWAAFRFDIESANLLIRAGANPKAANRDGATPLSLASINGDAVMINALVKGGANPNESLPTGKTNLMLAARTGSVEAINALIDAGASVNAKESLRGTTALMWAADEAHPPAVQALLKRGADFRMRSNPTARGRGPALGKAGDPRRQVAAQGAALAAGQPSPALPGFDDAGNPNAPPAADAGGRGGRGGRGAAAAAVDEANPDAQDQQADDAAAAGGGGGRGGGRGGNNVIDGGELTPLVYAARSNDVESARILLEAGADINQTTGYGWSPLLAATQNRNYKLAVFLLERGADVNLANKGGWTPLYIATDNRNIESGDYPVRRPDMDHLEYIKILLNKGANVNARVKDSTETRTVFTNQWLDENGATAFFRASQSGDVQLMKLLLSRGADPKIATVLNVTALQVAAGIGWVEGITFEWSPEATFEAVKMLLDLGIDPNIQADTGRTALHGAAHKGRANVVQILVDHGARLDIKDYGNTDNRGGKLAVKTWLPVDYADGLVRVGVQSAIGHPDVGLLMRKMMTDRGMQAPEMNRTLESICITEACE
jgi:ankyrin repeat protein